MPGSGPVKPYREIHAHANGIRHHVVEKQFDVQFGKLFADFDHDPRENDLAEGLRRGQLEYAATVMPVTADAQRDIDQLDRFLTTLVENLPVVRAGQRPGMPK